MDIQKKKVVVKVRPHVVQVGAKKLPDNGHPPEPIPQQPTLRRSLFRKCIDIVKEDLHLKRVETGAILKDEPNWEEYLRFRELANAGKKP